MSPVPVPLLDGTLVLPISLLTDCSSANETYWHLRSFLAGLKFRKVRATDWPPTLPEVLAPTLP